MKKKGNPMKLEEQLRECRKKSGLSQIELAEKLDVSRQARPNNS